MYFKFADSVAIRLLRHSKHSQTVQRSHVKHTQRGASNFEFHKKKKTKNEISEKKKIASICPNLVLNISKIERKIEINVFECAN